MQKNRLIYVFQPNVVKNKRNQKYAQWFEFAQKTRNPENKASDFEPYIHNSIFSDMKQNHFLLKGQIIDNETRCVHYHSNLDVIAIKFKCCDTYYPCFSCHEVEANHPTKIWQKADFDQLAILCGVCKQELTIHQYLASDAICPFCQAKLNPKCANHYQLYFDV